MAYYALCISHEKGNEERVYSRELHSFPSTNKRDKWVESVEQKGKRRSNRDFAVQYEREAISAKEAHIMVANGEFTNGVVKHLYKK